jgi:serine/threonine-protein kinase
MSEPTQNPASLESSAIKRLDDACDRFERDWKRALAGGPRPRIEDYLVRAIGRERDNLLDELVALDIVYRRRLGDTPNAQEYRERFPDLGPDLLEGVLAETALAGAKRGAPGGAGTASSYATLRPATRPSGQTTEPSTPPTDTASPRAGRYYLAEEIGTGGMGVVYRAHDPDLNRWLAVKVMKAEHGGRPELERRFLEEAQVTGQWGINFVFLRRNSHELPLAPPWRRLLPPGGPAGLRGQCGQGTCRRRP